MTLKLFWHNCGIEMRGCRKGPISPLHAAGGNYVRRRFFECVVRVVKASGSTTKVPCSNFLESVPGVCVVKKFMVASESKMLKTFFCTVVFEVPSLQLKVKLFNVGSGHWHRQRPNSARCFTEPPMVLARVACSLRSGQRREAGQVWLLCQNHFKVAFDK